MNYVIHLYAIYKNTTITRNNTIYHNRTVQIRDSLSKP